MAASTAIAASRWDGQQSIDAVRGAARYPYLDGGRIAAAAAVYAFHAEMAGFSWGYIGVDFFMVLSGFVVTVAVTGARPMSVATFLRARIARLLPGMLVFLVTATATLLLFADQRERLAVLGYIFPSGLYYSNWHSVFVADNYFNQNNINVYIHLWSLAVEEQFYIIFALTALLPVAFRAPAKAIVLGILIAGLILIHSKMSNDRFYFGTESRAVQFLVGSLIAHWRAQISSLIGWIPLSVVAAAAAAAIIAAIYLSLDHKTYFHRGYIACTIAAALFMITSVRGAIAGAPVSPALELLGHSSYTQYLLHMPLVFVISKVGAQTLPWQLGGLAVLVLASTAISAYVEVPAQRKLRALRPKIVLLLAPAALIAAAGASYFLLLSSLHAAVRNTNFATGYFFCGNVQASCLRAGNPKSPAILLLGDSIVSSALDGALLSHALRTPDTAFVTGTIPNCAIRNRLSLNVEGRPHVNFQKCIDRLPRVIAHAMKTYDIRLVIVSSTTDAQPFLLADGQQIYPTDPRWMGEALDGALHMLAPIKAAGIAVAIAIPPQHVAKIECLSDAQSCSVPRLDLAELKALYRAISAEIPQSYIVDLNDALCAQEECPLVIEDKITRYDGGHFTRDSSVALSERLVSTLLNRPPR